MTRFSNGIEKARSEYYRKLADHFLAEVNVKPVCRILEAGCGKGQLTIPLLERLPRTTSLVALDSSRGDYEGSLDALRSRLGTRPKRKVSIVQSDVLNIQGIGDRSVDVVISNELLCDLKSEREVLCELQFA